GAAPYRLIDIDEIDADIVAVNAMAWGGPPIGALVFRDPSLIESFSSVSLNPNATGPERLEIGVPQFGLLGGLIATPKAFRLNAIGGGLPGRAVRLSSDLVAFAAAGDDHRGSGGAHSGA